MGDRPVVISLSHSRPEGTKKILSDLYRQSYKNFDIIISNSNEKIHEDLHRHIIPSRAEIRKDFDRPHPIRRFYIAKEVASRVIIFLDDDIKIPQNFVEKCIEKYEENTLKSWWAFEWGLINKNNYQYLRDRKRIFDKKVKAGYLGTGVMVADGKIFENDLIFSGTQKIPAVAWMEDIWLSYCCDILGYNKKYLDIHGVSLGGDDEAALYKKIQKSDYNKNDFVNDLIKNNKNWPEG